MHRLSSTLRASAGAAALAAATLASAAGPTFYYHRLPALPGGHIRPADINEAGEVAASSGDQWGQSPFELVMADRFGGLETLTSGFEDARLYEATAMNEAGQVVGKIHSPSGAPLWVSLFRYTPGVGAEDIGHLSGVNGEATAINAAGDVVGYWQTAGGFEHHAFYYSDAGGMKALPDDDAVGSRAVGVSDTGLAAGHIYTVDNHVRPVVWQAGQMEFAAWFEGEVMDVTKAGDILMNQYATWGGGPWVRMANGQQIPVFCFGPLVQYGIAMSDSGYVIGTGWTPGDISQRAWRFKLGTWELIDIGVLPGFERATLPTAVNDHGHIAGLAVSENYDVRPFYWSEETGIVDLHTQRSDDDWWCSGVVGFNNADHIVIGGNLLSASNHPVGAVFSLRRPGDLNGDRVVNFADIDAFVAALSGGGSAFQDAYPMGDARNGDINWDGAVNFADIDLFVELLGR